MKHIVIKCCASCPFMKRLNLRSNDPDDPKLYQHPVCTRAGEFMATIDDEFTIPEWCVLKDYSALE